MFQLWVALFKDPFSVLNTNCSEGLGEIALGYCLDTENIIRIEDRFEVISGEEGAFWKTVELSAVGISVLCVYSLNVLKRLNYV